MNKQRQPRRERNYQAFLTLGVAVVVLGLTMTTSETEGLSVPIIGAGIACLAIGLVARAKVSVQPSSEPLPTKKHAAPGAEVTTPGEQSPGT